MQDSNCVAILSRQRSRVRAPSSPPYIPGRLMEWMATKVTTRISTQHETSSSDPSRIQRAYFVHSVRGVGRVPAQTGAGLQPGPTGEERSGLTDDHPSGARGRCSTRARNTGRLNLTRSMAGSPRSDRAKWWGREGDYVCGYFGFALLPRRYQLPSAINWQSPAVTQNARCQACPQQGGAAFGWLRRHWAD